MSKRILSGVQATGSLHIGNYLGIMKPWTAWQDRGQAFYFIPDLHSLNVRPEPAKLSQNTLNNVAWLLAVGIDPKKSIIFAQSQVPAHAELFAILNNYVTMGELSRMTQYKDKASRFGERGQLAGLFEYPVLMAADILLYDAGTVPVGADQKQHVELARDIATRFNNLHGETFVLPQPVFPDYGAKVMSLQDPDKKMSKSDPDPLGKVELLDDPKDIETKIKRAVTDSGTTIEASDSKPAITNLLQIYAAFSGKTVAELEQEYAGVSYRQFKKDLANTVTAELGSLQKRYQDLLKDEARLRNILAQGRVKAMDIAGKKIDTVKEKVGLITL